MNQALVIDGELKMVRHELAGLTRSGVSDDHRFRREATLATAVVTLTSSSTVTASALLVVVRVALGKALVAASASVVVVAPTSTEVACVVVIALANAFMASVVWSRSFHRLNDYNSLIDTTDKSPTF
jgi:hypothetical protein